MHKGTRGVFGKLQAGGNVGVLPGQRGLGRGREPEAGWLSAGGREEETLPESQNLPFRESATQARTRGAGPGKGPRTRTPVGVTRCPH